MFIIRDIFNENNQNKCFHYKLISGEMAKFKSPNMTLNVASISIQ